MAIPAKNNFTIYQGSTFDEVIRWEDSKKVYKNITAITKAAPCVVTSATHGVPDGWRITITDVVGMKEINSEDYVIATVSNPNSIELNDINAASFSTYTSGGVITYNDPVDLAGYTARMQIRAKLDSTTVLDELTTENGGITIDNVNKTINLYVSAVDTAAYTFASGVYSLEMIKNGDVKTISIGSITVKKEVTR